MRSFTLTKEQVELAFDTAKKIQQSKAYTRGWSVDNIALGILGEIAYGLMTGNPINTDVWNDKSDGGIDFPDGTDVKTISYQGPDPELKMGKIPVSPKATKLVLAVCNIKKNPNEVKLVGEISMDNFKIKASKRQYGDMSWFAVTSSELDKIYE